MTTANSTTEQTPMKRIVWLRSQTKSRYSHQVSSAYIHLDWLDSYYSTHFISQIPVICNLRKYMKWDHPTEFAVMRQNSPFVMTAQIRHFMRSHSPPSCLCTRGILTIGIRIDGEVVRLVCPTYRRMGTCRTSTWECTTKILYSWCFQCQSVGFSDIRH